MTSTAPRQKHTIYGKPMVCCARQKIVNMDHRSGMIEADVDQPWIINRACLTCGKHWYGQAGQVRVFTKAEWSVHLDDQLAEAQAAVKARRDEAMA